MYTFQICFPDKTLTIQNCSIAQINVLEEDDNLVVNKHILLKIIFKLGVLLERSIPLAHARLDTHIIFRYKLLYTTLILEKVAFL